MTDDHRFAAIIAANFPDDEWEHTDEELAGYLRGRLPRLTRVEAYSVIYQEREARHRD